ncbi:putative RNA polymerase II subunit B1 CTD phosphatase RPAP2 homolog [Phragmites australis]|uniref:putative RNA polymerase II subunit B1 CTD phosphatase RPAP2 homolog n=1 Tax=Phragmites australis TaxID=29695 RepID=UPI002D79A9BF|nr:putative RNA polymerase II subunit B1 CTD phosphatase RPAP2 homolog [Phragmites australis]
MGPSPSPAAGARPAAETRTVASAVYRIQLLLLDGAAASNEPLLHAAASALLSRPDYDDVVTERSIADACGHPACPNPLPPATSTNAPRFHISLREHRVYDLEEARKFCSERCLVASAAFAASLPPERPYGAPPERLDAVVALVEGRGGDGPELGFRDADGKKGDEGRKVEIRVKEVAGAGEVTLQDWIGPSDAIEGYVPHRDRSGEGPKPEAKQNKVTGPGQSKNKNVDSRNAAPGEDGMPISSSSVETHVSSEVIAKKMGNMILSEDTKTQRKKTSKTPSKMLKQEDDNEILSSCISDSIAKQLEDVVLEEKKGSKKKKASKASSRAQKSKPRTRPAGSDGHEVNFTSAIIIGDASTNMDEGTMGQYNYLSGSILAGNHPSSSQCAAKDSTQAYVEQLYEEFSKAVNIGNDETSDEKMRPSLKSSLKVAGSKSGTQSVTWADKNGSVLGTSKAYESHSNDKKQSEEGIDSSLRRASAEACAAALIEAAEAISSGTSEVEDAVSKAGIIILPDMLHQNQYDNAKSTDGDESDDECEVDRDVVKWPKKTVLLDTDMFEVDDSLHDTPPEGFSLTLSTFATMWAALFGWISRSSLAYVYGLDGGSVEELLISNGREYPEKIVLKDGHSSEIRRALDTCVCNALPVLISNLRLQIPVSKLEITLGYLIDTMSFVDALPSLRSRQWQVVILVLLDALSVHRLPAIFPAISNLKLLQKVLNAAQISREEYDSMVDLFLPFGRSVQTPVLI